MDGPLSWVTSELFADDKLPCPFDRNAVASNKTVWTGPPGMSTFSCFPDLAKDEETERWFNLLAQFLGVVHGYGEIVPRSEGFEHIFDPDQSSRWQWRSRLQPCS